MINHQVEVWVTGLGIISGLGAGYQTHLEAIKQSRTGLQAHNFFEGKNPDPVICGLIPHAALPFSIEQSVANRADLILDYAFNEALSSSALNPDFKSDLFVGTTLGNMHGGSEYYRQVKNEGRGEISLVKGFLSCSLADTIALKYHISGKRFTVSTACSSGAAAIGMGLRRIQNGLSERVIACGVDALSPFVVAGFNSLQLLSKKGCKPFDRDRDGLNPGEGAAVLVLEKREAAEKRGVNPIARLIGFGDSLEAYHQTRSHPEGRGITAAFKKIFEQTGISEDEIHHVHLHGTATQFNDISEYNAMKNIFDEKLHHIPVCSTKSMTGHTYGGAGAIASVFAVMSLNEKIVPPTLNHETLDPAFQGLNISNRPVKPLKMATAAVSSMGFGGEVAVLLFGMIQ